MASNYAKSRIKTIFSDAESTGAEISKLHAVNGQMLAETLGELKGAIMKMGQIASVASDILPTEIADALRTLQKDSPPMDFELIESQIERELGAPIPVLFQSFDPKPFAAASIGQVHRARIDDGREVIVKIQYPGVDGAVDSDLRHLKVALAASGLIKLSRKAIDNMLVEFRSRLHEELDYCNEAENVRKFREIFKDDPRVVIPDVIGERSSQRVLTLTYEPSIPLTQITPKTFSKHFVNQAGKTLFEIMATQLFIHLSIHADPNPANFGFRENGKLVLYDFGCIKILDTETITIYKATIRAALEGKFPETESLLIQLGARNPKGPALNNEFFSNWTEILLRPFQNTGPFDFGRSTIHHDVIKNIPAFLTKHASGFQPAKELVFVDRVIGGHYGNLCKLGCRIDSGALLRKHLYPSRETA
ncbi:MAG: AarF/ABC1/UbiB kinase family protein [Myxococcota bacterium]|nr:AarF/ABC1/UbiB kinase family protein [Myxococcota bacterium]